MVSPPAPDPRPAGPPRRLPRPRRPRGALTAGALCVCSVALAAAGCGNGAAADRSRFVDEANGVCARANLVATDYAGRIAHAQRGSDPARVYRDVAALTRERTAAARRALDRLDALELPGGDRDRLKTWIADQRRRQTLVLALAAAFTRRADAAISRLSQRIDALGSSANAFAGRYGLDDCARTVP